jgi:hypothetical protein
MTNLPNQRVSDSPPATRDSRLATPLRPAHICDQLLAALDASEGRRRKRKRNTTPDSIGIAIKRALLEETVRDDPQPHEFEGWLVEHSESGSLAPSGPARSMALEILADWRLAQTSEVFRTWLERGAPSDDAAGAGS